MSDEARENLLRQGIRLFEKHGYHATGIQQIASAAGISKGSFCYYFPSKEAFARAVIARYADEIEAGILRTLARTELPALARLRAYFETSLAAMKADGFSHGCAIGNLLAEIGDTHEPLLRALRQAWERVRAGLALFLAEARETGDLAATANTLRMADVLLSGWEGALISMRAQHNTRSIEDFLDLVLPLVVSVQGGTLQKGRVRYNGKQDAIA